MGVVDMWLFFVGVALVNTISIVAGVLLINAYAGYRRRKILTAVIREAEAELAVEIEKSKVNKSFGDIIADQVRYDIENGGIGKGIADE